ncbi:efflux RND transporter permease subunit [Treponema pedis]|nr:MMPL family transporter [Treponema pedis]
MDKKDDTIKKNTVFKRVFSTKRFYEHTKTMLITILAITLFFALQLIRLRFDNNNFRFIPKNDVSRVNTQKITDIFGDEVPILIGLERQFSSILEKPFLDEIKKLEENLKKLELVKNIVLLTNTKHIEAGNGEIITESLIPENFSGTEEEVKIVKRKLRSWPLYTRSLVSEDVKATQILIFLNVTNEESGSPEAVEACRKIIALTDAWSFPDSKIYLTGTPVFNEIVNQATAHDLTVLVPLVIAIVVAVLFLSFGRFSGVFLPLLTVIVSVIWALGAMALFQVPLSILSTILPIILIAVGSAYGIHVINNYYDEVVQDDVISKEEHKTQVIRALREVIRPVFLAALTTFAGFVSFCFTSVVPIFEFGIFASFGVMSAFLISITLIPSILIIRGPKKASMKWARKHNEEKSSKFDRGISNTFVIIAQHSRSVVVFAAVIVVISVFGLKKLVIDNVLMEYFDKETSVVQSDLFMREKFGGSKLLNLLITVNDGSTVIRPDILKALDDMAVFLEEEVSEVGKVTSITELLKRINQVYNADELPEGLSVKSAEEIIDAEKNKSSDTDSKNAEDEDFWGFGEAENDTVSFEEETSLAVRDKKSERFYSQREIMNFLTDIIGERNTAHISAEKLLQGFGKKTNYDGLAYYEIPVSPEKYGKKTQSELIGVIENYLILLGKNAEEFVDNTVSPKMLKVNIQLRTVGQQDTDRAMSAINKFIEMKFPKDVKVETGGFVLIEKSLNHLVVESQLISVGVSLFIVFLILSVYYRSAIAGIIGIIPLSLSILANFGFMGFLGIKLNIGTAMVASFAIGIGVDYTIHFLAAYHKCILKMGDTGSFLYSAFLGSGKAILFNAVSVGAGFAVLMLSKFNMLAELGFLIALVMVTSSLGSLTVLPILLNLLKPKFIKKVLPVDR